MCLPALSLPRPLIYFFYAVLALYPRGNGKDVVKLEEDLAVPHEVFLDACMEVGGVGWGG